MWGTTLQQPRKRMLVLISIHVPRVGHDSINQGYVTEADLFQSTCPVWGTTA